MSHIGDTVKVLNAYVVRHVLLLGAGNLEWRRDEVLVTVAEKK